MKKRVWIWVVLELVLLSTGILMLSGCNNYTTSQDAQNVQDAQDATSETGFDTGAQEESAPGEDSFHQEAQDGGSDLLPDRNPESLPECTEASDCKLYSDCCNCLALAPGESAPRCEIRDCKTDACSLLNIDGSNSPLCVAGRCIIGADCDYNQVVCLGPQPVCEPGEINSVRGICWGPCVQTSECLFVPDCADCEADLYACVSLKGDKDTSHHCVTPPAPCEKNRTCACMGQSFCLDPFVICTDSPEANEIICGL